MTNDRIMNQKVNEISEKLFHTNSVSSIERGDDYEPTQAYYRYVEECEEEATKLYD